MAKRGLKKEQIRNKADKLLQEYIRLNHKNELCWYCGERPVSVGHHFVYVSQSTACRYYLPNIIPLCRDCHYYAHNWQNLFSAKITLKLGKEWYNDLMERKQIMIKFNKEWITIQYQILKDLFDEKKI